MNPTLADRIRVEISEDPAGRGYAEKSVAEIATLMGQPVPQAVPAPHPRPFRWREARGLAQRLGWWPWAVARARQTPSLPIASVEDAAILAAIGAVEMHEDQLIEPADPTTWDEFTQCLDLFVAVGDLPSDVAAAIRAVGVEQPPTPPDGLSRWAALIDGVGGVNGEPGPANVPDEAMIAEAINGNG